MKVLTDAEAAYAAGVFDARLHFRTDERRGVELSVSGDELLVEWLTKRLGGKTYQTKRGHYTWRLYSKREIASILHYIQPHMLVKQGPARKARDFCTLPRRNAKQG